MKIIQKSLILLFLMSVGIAVCGNSIIGKTKNEPKYRNTKKVKIRRSPRVYDLNRELRHKKQKRK